ncbi:hypothetical protein FG91_03300 [Sphingopyxis sp. LC81]|nr:hypothetical protein FG91_03300 [Sphingopyxis sp. LC81]
MIDGGDRRRLKLPDTTEKVQQLRNTADMKVSGARFRD